MQAAPLRASRRPCVPPRLRERGDEDVVVDRLSSPRPGGPLRRPGGPITALSAAYASSSLSSSTSSSPSLSPSSVVDALSFVATLSGDDPNAMSFGSASKPVALAVVPGDGRGLRRGGGARASSRSQSARASCHLPFLRSPTSTCTS
eukprot:6192622-Pleurochrysis_carterae.AAC.1